MRQMEISDKLKLIPDLPGVYLMKDGDGQVIYVGKAISLRNRARSYFQSPTNLPPKTQALVAQIRDIDYITTDSEVEALILEAALIKRYLPKYNVRIRDDKQYPYVRIDLNGPFARPTIVRQVKKDGARYFGPYTRPSAVYEALKLARRLFPFRSCRDVTGKVRPCLNFHIQRCLAPCVGKVSQEDYRRLIDRLVLFLEGRTEVLVPDLEREMNAAAENLEFEKAARWRDQIQAISQAVERQKVFSNDLADQDVVGYFRSGDEATVQVFFFRDGRLEGRESLVISGFSDLSDAEFIGQFLEQYYAEAEFLPRQILLPESPEGEQTISRWLSQRRGHRVYLLVPRRGEKKRLVEMVTQNARLAQLEREASHVRQEGSAEAALDELAQALDLPEPPRRIECYDISNIQGTEAVGSMVVFEDGVPARDQYRRFKIRSVIGPNDFAMMQELLYRRFRRGLEERARITERGGLGREESSFERFPDLLIIDGGKGQLSAGREVLRELGLEHLATAGLAKREEHLFIEGHSDPIILPRDSDGLYLVQRIRDEAHRFAISYHRQLRSKRATRTKLDEIAGIGPKRRTALLRRFGSVKKLREATVEEIAAVEGMNRAIAEQVYEFLRGGSQREPGGSDV